MRSLKLQQLESRNLLAGDAQSCSDLATLQLDDTEVTRARPLPTMCVVFGTIEETINFQLIIPAGDRWNGKSSWRATAASLVLQTMTFAMR